MELFDQFKRGVVAVLNSKTTSKDLAGQIEGLAPTGIARNRNEISREEEIKRQEYVIAQQQREIDELTLIAIHDDWVEIRNSFSQGKELMTLTLGNKIFWKRETSRIVWEQNLQAIIKALKKFLKTHRVDIHDIAHRDYPCFQGRSEMETRKWHKAVFQDIDGVVSDISSSIESMIPMRDNPGLDAQIQTDSTAAGKMHGFCSKIDLLFYNYESSLNGMKELVKGYH